MLKRLFDITVSLLALLLLAVPLMLIAAWIRWDSPGPALFRQERVGLHGRLFRIHKFRTMHGSLAHGGDAQGHAVAEPQLTAEGDPRITPAGRWLRTRRLDELPQFIDVLFGKMSVVGPRPEVPRYVALYPELLRQQVLAVRPGITDPTSLAYRDEGRLLAKAADPERFYVQELLPRKLQMQIDYANRATPWSDIKVLWATLKVLWGDRP